MPSTNNLVAKALGILALMAASIHASTQTIIEVQLFNDNENCQGSPNAQNFQYFAQDFCYTGITGGPPAHIDVVDIATHKVVASNIDSISLSCQRPTFSTGQTCEKHFHKTVGSFCLRYYEGDQFVYSIRISCYPCRPYPTISKSHCNKLIHTCENLALISEYDQYPIPVQMKWTGRGCRADGHALSDGGCQCDGYCGYTCERACNADSQCYWDTNTNQCFSAATNAPGEPIKFCFPEQEAAPQIKKSNGKIDWFIKP